MDGGISRSNSRFSTLRVFNKFSNRPPPPPPKDPYYLHNSPSTISLSTRSFSAASSVSEHPSATTPLTPQYMYPNGRSLSPAPSQSTMATSPSSSSSDSGSFKRSLFKLGSSVKRPFTPKAPSKSLPPMDDLQPPEPVDDGSISYPWNFEHHVHVDDGFVGLPPSWSSSLSEAGFTPEEIAAIHARRNPNLAYLHNTRPRSPGSSSVASSVMSQQTILTNPAPRSDSLRRRPSNATTTASSDLGSGSGSGPYMNSDIGLGRPQPHFAYTNPGANLSAPSVSTAHIRAPPQRPPPPPPSESDVQMTTLASPTLSQSRTAYPTASEEKRALAAATFGGPGQGRPTPLTFRVTNDVDPLSPPPAYGSPGRSAVSKTFDSVKGASGYSSGSSSSVSTPVPLGLRMQEVMVVKHDGGRQEEGDQEKTPEPVETLDEKMSEVERVGGEKEVEHEKEQGEGDEGDSLDDRDSRRISVLARPRLSVLPPRLSLHQDSGEDWTQLLLSAIPSVSLQAESSTAPLSTTPKSPPAPLVSISFAADPGQESDSASEIQVTHEPLKRKLAPQRPLPSIALPSVPDEELPQTSTPLWDEVMGMIQLSPSTAQTLSPPMSLPTANPESPIIPLTESLLTEYSVTQDDELHVPGPQRDRDSNQSILSDASTITDVIVTAAIVRDASFATRASANVVASPIRSGPPRIPLPPTPTEATTASSLNTASLSPMSAFFPPAPPRPASQHSAHSSASSSFTASDSSLSFRQTLSSSSNEEDPMSPPPPLASSVRVQMSDEKTVHYIPGGSIRVDAIPSSNDVDVDTHANWVNPDSGEEEKDEEVDQYDDVADVVDDWIDAADLESPVEGVDESCLARHSFVDWDGDEEDESVLPLESERPSIAIHAISPDAQQLEHSSVSSRQDSLSVSSPVTPATPMTPARQYRGWQYQVIAPLLDFVHEGVDPRERYTDLLEIAEGESGSVFSAHTVGGSTDDSVAIKSVPILPSGSPKLEDLRRELVLMANVRHEHILAMDALYVDLLEDSLWIRMELMDRSLADVVALVDEGLVFQEKMIARLANDVLLALDHLQGLCIAHRDVRSDNLLINRDGILKLADFSNAVQVTRADPTRSDIVGVIYWQAPEMRRGRYNALHVDAWSLGATVWEMAQTEPPFADIEDPRQIGDQLPSLDQPEVYSRSFHDFLRLCSQPSSCRLSPSDLLHTQFIRSACSRPVIAQLLSHCRSIEEKLQRRQSGSSHGTIS